MFHKRYIRFTLLGALVVILLLSANVGAVRTVSAAAPGATVLPTCSALTNFNSKNFSSPLKINNQFYPLVPGTRFVLEGSINTNGGTVPNDHQVVLTVTDLTKVINGVRTRVLWDTDTNGGVLVESELAFQAQDNAGNVWVLGEYPEEFVDGVFDGAPNTWINGIDKAKGGVLVPGKQKVGSNPFIEAKSLSIDFWDCGQVDAVNQSITIATGTTYNNVLVINEWNPLVDGYQQKYYAPGVGNVQIGARDDPEGETLSLTSVTQLGPLARLKANLEALKLDRRGYQNSTVYSQTTPIVR